MDPIFEEEVDNIEQLCHKYSSGINDVMLVSDPNMDLIRENAHSKHISQLAYMDIDMESSFVGITLMLTIAIHMNTLVQYTTPL